MSISRSGRTKDNLKTQHIFYKNKTQCSCWLPFRIDSGIYTIRGLLYVKLLQYISQWSQLWITAGSFVGFRFSSSIHGSGLGQIVGEIWELLLLCASLGMIGFFFTRKSLLAYADWKKGPWHIAYAGGGMGIPTTCFRKNFPLSTRQRTLPYIAALHRELRSSWRAAASGGKDGFVKTVCFPSMILPAWYWGQEMAVMYSISRPKKPMLPETKKIFAYVKSYLQEAAISGASRHSPVRWARRLWTQKQQWGGGCLCPVVCGGVVCDRRYKKENGANKS